MSNIRNFAVVALAGLLAAPMSAQVVQNPGTVRDRVEAARRRAEEARRVEGQADVRRDGRANSKVPPGHLPPKGMCRVWIDGVPPGQQPPVTDCVTAELNRTANSRVIYGDRESFPGRGKGKFKGDRVRGDDRLDDDDFDEARISKSERKAAKAEGKGNKGKGGRGRGK